MAIMDNLNIKNSFGRRIKNIRKKRDWTQAQLAEKVGVDAKHISCIESGKNFPSPELIEKLSKSLEKHPKELFEFENEPSNVDLKKEIIKSLDKASEDEIEKIFIYTKFILG